MTNAQHFTPDGKLTDAGRTACERFNNESTIEATGNYDMDIIATYDNENVAYIAMQIRREKAASDSIARATGKE